MPKINLHIKKHHFIPKYLPYIWDETPLQIFFGGASSGKSVHKARQCVLDLLKGKRNYFIVRNVATTIRHSVFTEIVKAIKFFRVYDHFAINHSSLTITCNLNDRQAIFRGLDDVEKVKSVTPKVGVITDLWVEEATEIAEFDYRQLCLRMRGDSDVPKRVHLTFNPVNREHWICKRLMDGFSIDEGVRHTDRLLIVHSTYKDNTFLTDQDRANIEALKSDKDPYYYNVYALGEWGTLGELVLPNFEVRDLSDMRDSIQYPRNGLDFGFANDPTAFIQSTKKGDEIYILNEMYGHGLTNDVIAERIRGYVGNGIVWCDSSEPKSIADLRRAANPINAQAVSKGRDSVMHGTMWLRQHKIIVHKECQNFINEISTWQWEKNKNGDTLNRPVDTNNHGPDALRYAYEREMNRVNLKILTTDNLRAKEAAVA